MRCRPRPTVPGPRAVHKHAPIESRACFESIRYSNCWEDAGILCRALRPRPGRRILSIASAGDNALALAAEGAEVVAADLSLAQLACLELRRAAFRRLDHDGVLRLLGARPESDRLSIYSALAIDLSPAVARFWSAHPDVIDRGVLHAGRFERYLHAFRRWILPLVHSRRDVQRLMEPRPASERSRFYEEVWDNRRWRALFRVFFSRFLLGRGGRDPEFFRYAEGPVSERLLARVREGLSTLPLHANPYLDYILNGNFTRCLPRYLEPERFDAVREGVERVTIHHGPVEEAAEAHGAEGFDGFNLSDIFEYADPVTCREIHSRLLAHARSGARLAYWNMLTPRRSPSGTERAFPRDDVARRLFREDQAFFYSAFLIEEVR